VIVFLLRFGVAYLPDYALSYLDFGTDFGGLYDNSDKVGLLRQRSSLLRKKSKQNSTEEQKQPIQIIGTGKRAARVADSAFGDEDEYYDEM